MSPNHKPTQTHTHTHQGTLCIQGYELLVPVYLFPVVGDDLILGATLGPHVADYSTLSLKFFHVGRFITLTDEKDRAPSIKKDGVMMDFLKQGGVVVLEVSILLCNQKSIGTCANASKYVF